MNDEKKVVFRQSGNVLLRPVQEEDIPLLCKWANDQQVTVYLNLYLPMNENDEKDWVQKIRANGKDVVLTIELEEDGVFMPVGNIGLHSISARDRTTTLGIIIGEKKHWGKCIGEKAIQLMLEYAFNSLNLRKVSLAVFSKNERAKKLYTKCGFQEEGVLKENHFRHGEYLDEIRMAVFRKDWLKTQ